MKKTVGTIFALVVFLAPPVSAQDIHVGLRAGVNFSNFSGEADTEFGPRSAFTATVYFRTELSQIVEFVPELGYSVKGAATDEVILEGVPTGLEAVFSLPYLDVNAPLLIKPMTFGAATPYVLAGPSLGYRLDARVELIDPDTGESVTQDDSSIEKYDFGIQAGIGTYYNLGSQKLTVEARYYRGLTDVRDRPDAPLRNSNVGILVGVSL